MTDVMDAPRTGEITITGSGTPRTDKIVEDIAGSVWELLRAGELSGALVLLRVKAPAFEQAWREEMVGIRAPEVPPVPEPAKNCTSTLHTLLSCADALAKGRLREDQPFCSHCSEQVESTAEAPRVPETGRIVHVVTTAGTKRRRAS